MIVKRPPGIMTLTLTAVLCGCAGCDLPGRPKPSDRPVRADQVVGFVALYRQYCAGCHGDHGKLGPAPPLNDPLFLAIVPDAELQRVIAEGRPGTPMPAFARERGGPLTEAQVDALAQGIKPRWGPPRAPSGNVPMYAVSDNGPHGEAKSGARVFERACAGCHGPDGRGDDAGAVHDRTFLALISNQALRRYAITGRPDLGMPSYHDRDGRDDDFQPLSPREIDDLVALFAQWRSGNPADGS